MRKKNERCYADERIGCLFRISAAILKSSVPFFYRSDQEHFLFWVTFSRYFLRERNNKETRPTNFFFPFSVTCVGSLSSTKKQQKVWAKVHADASKKFCWAF